jgi:antitoxin PrlF
MSTVPTKDFDVTVTSKGQMTLPAGVRGALGIEAGDRFALTVNDKGEIRLVKKTASFRDSIGLLAHLAGNRSMAQEDETSAALDAAMREQEDRSRKADRVAK